MWDSTDTSHCELSMILKLRGDKCFSGYPVWPGLPCPCKLEADSLEARATPGEVQKRGEPGNLRFRSNDWPLRVWNQHLHLAALLQLWPVLEVAVCCLCSSRCGILNVLTF